MYKYIYIYICIHIRLLRRLLLHLVKADGFASYYSSLHHY